MNNLKQKTFKDQDKVETVLREFEKIARFPRKSGHEEAVSAYLVDWAKQQGLQVFQDEKKNVIIDKSAAVGYEAAPRVILQGHMDMVCVAAEGKTFDPLKDGIEIVREGNFLRANGTTLGADDGIGVATALYVLQNKSLEHGPLRVIATVDEEEGMSGAEGLDGQFLDAKYLINCDSEDFDVVTVGSAGSVALDVTGSLDWETVDNAYQPVTLQVKGLLGGHSGTMIHEGRANAIKILALALRELKASNVLFRLGKMAGGTARNAIPSVAQAVIFLRENQKGLLDQVLKRVSDMVGSMYGAKESNCHIFYEPATHTMRVALVEESADRLLRFLWFAKDGVQAMSHELAGLVESSANIGVISIQESEMNIQIFPRSSKDVWLELDKAQYGDLARLCGFTLQSGAQSASWPVNACSELLPAVKAAFQEQPDIAFRVETIHAGLECSWFYKKNPHLDMISIGPTITGAHSPRETLHIDTLLPHIKVLESVLRRLKK